jgi:putative SbcD/Mre11-related phosphoesterase
MNHARLEVAPGVILDARRAVYLADENLLAVADLHLGYAWAHRHRGQLLPLSKPDDTGERLSLLIDEYQPKSIALLGDIVHDAVPIAEFRQELRAFLSLLESRAEVRLIAGNHDRSLAKEITQPLIRDLQVDRHRLVHGDGHSEATARAILDQTERAGGLLLMGHEHPAIGISDRVAHFARVPCFLVSPHLIVLPAFSSWAAGCEIRRGEFLSPFPTISPPEKAVAILANKLLPIPLRRA